MYHKNYYKKPIYLPVQAHEVKNHVTSRENKIDASEWKIYAVIWVVMIAVAVRLVLGV